MYLGITRLPWKRLLYIYPYILIYAHVIHMHIYIYMYIYLGITRLPWKRTAFSLGPSPFPAASMLLPRRPRSYCKLV
jgi:hypothetical protein